MKKRRKIGGRFLSEIPISMMNDGFMRFRCELAKLISVNLLEKYVASNRALWLSLSIGDRVIAIIKFTRKYLIGDMSNPLFKCLQKCRMEDLSRIYRTHIQVKEMSKYSLIWDLISKFNDIDSQMERRVNELSILEGARNDLENDFDQVHLHGILIPNEILSIIMSFLDRSYSTVVNVGMISRACYTLLISSFENVRVSSNNVYGISILSLRNAKHVSFHSIIESEQAHVWKFVNADKLRTIEILDGGDYTTKAIKSIYHLSQQPNFKLLNITKLITFGDFQASTPSVLNRGNFGLNLGGWGTPQVPVIPSNTISPQVPFNFQNIFPKIECVTGLNSKSFTTSLFRNCTNITTLGFVISGYRTLETIYQKLSSDEELTEFLSRIRSLSLSNIDMNYDQQNENPLLKIYRLFRNIEEVKLNFRTNIQRHKVKRHIYGQTLDFSSFKPPNEVIYDRNKDEIVFMPLQKLCIHDDPLIRFDTYSSLRQPKKDEFLISVVYPYALTSLKELTMISHTLRRESYYETINFSLMGLMNARVFETNTNMKVFKGSFPLCDRGEKSFSRKKKKKKRKKKKKGLPYFNVPQRNINRYGQGDKSASTEMELLLFAGKIVKSIEEFLNFMHSKLSTFESFEIEVKAMNSTFREESFRLKYKTRLSTPFPKFHSRRIEIEYISRLKKKFCEPLNGIWRKSDLVSMLINERRPCCLLFQLFFKRVINILSRKGVMDVVCLKVPEKVRFSWFKYLEKVGIPDFSVEDEASLVFTRNQYLSKKKSSTERIVHEIIEID